MNKLALLVKDEEGMTLVELLAVIVILSIVAAIGGVAIAGVIQRSREDARVADIQMLYEAATLAEASDSYISKNTTVTAAALNTQGYATSVNFLMDNASPAVSTANQVIFSVTPGAGGAADKLVVAIPANVTFAGSKGNKDLTTGATALSGAKEIKALTRTTLF
ncbi:type II secretion system protein [Lactococcus carnosus]|uniref:Type II secretion system protein n=1 Tax=Pseudolactococcus carnosus TaxID=2749961 RepID=A0ABT0AUW8_9LACT|nr:type II secretion system protein [Lactococcus carnosus]MCJ1990394.1 type II secretion system protein [Lactococcus carnosus]